MLLLKVQTGDIARYTVKMVFDDGGQKAEMSGKAEDRITKVEPNGNVTNEHNLFGMKVKIGDQEIDVSDTKKQISVLKPTGEILEMPGLAAQEGRFAYATMIVVPEAGIKDGEVWSREFSPKGARPVRQEYTAVKPEKVGSFESMKLRFKSWETSGARPIKAEGTAWVTLADGRLARLEATVDGVPMGDDGKPTKLSLTLERVP
jgi:hypothetical protein